MTNRSPQIVHTALEWLRETDTLDVVTMKRAIWEDLRLTATGEGTAVVKNHSYHEPDDHAHAVGIEPSSGIVHHCTCPQYKYRDAVCKHMVAAALAIDEGEFDLREVGVEDPAREVSA